MTMLTYFACFYFSEKQLSAHRGGSAGDTERLSVSVNPSRTQRNSSLTRNQEYHTSNLLKNTEQTTNDVQEDQQNNERVKELSLEATNHSSQTEQKTNENTVINKSINNNSESFIDSPIQYCADKRNKSHDVGGGTVYNIVIDEKQGFKMYPVIPESDDGFLNTLCKKWKRLFYGYKKVNPEYTTEQHVDLLLSDDHSDTDCRIQKEKENAYNEKLKIFKSKIELKINRSKMRSSQVVSCLNEGLNNITPENLDKITTSFFNDHISGTNMNIEQIKDVICGDEEAELLRKMMIDVINSIEQVEFFNLCQNFKNSIDMLVDNYERKGYFFFNYSKDAKLRKDKQLTVDITKLALNFRKKLISLPSQKNEAQRIEQHIKSLKVLLADYIEYKGDEGEDNKLIFICMMYDKNEEILKKLIDHEIFNVQYE